MRFFTFFAILALSVVTVAGLDCQQIPSSSIHDGSSFYWPPTNSTTYVPIPPNFDCIYVISPITNTSLLYAKVELSNLLHGVNDRITVIDSLGTKTVLTSRSDSYLIYDLFPGKPMTIQVTTKSVNMGSEFLIRVSYHNVKVGPTRQLKTGGAMNYVDMSDLRGETVGYMDSVTLKGTEPLSLSMAVFRSEYPTLYLFNTYVIDGDFSNPLAVHRLIDFTLTAPLVTSSNTVTFVSFQTLVYYDTAVVINPLSEAQQFESLTAAASPGGELERISFNMLDGVKEAVEVLAVEANQITMTSLHFNKPISNNCIAKVVTGPPNQSSQLLLDLTKAENLMPYTFKLKYFSVIAENCSFTFSVTSPVVPK